MKMAASYLLLSIFAVAAAVDLTVTPLGVLVHTRRGHQRVTRNIDDSNNGIGHVTNLAGDGFFISHKHSSSKRSHYQARAYCKDKFEGGLVILDTTHKINLIADHLKTHSGSNFKVWTAGKSMRTSNTRYQWQLGDDIPNNDTLWAEGEPNNDGGDENCIMALFKETHKNGTRSEKNVSLYTQGCDSEYMFICEMYL